MPGRFACKPRRPPASAFEPRTAGGFLKLEPPHMSKRKPIINEQRRWSAWLQHPQLRPWPANESEFQLQVIELLQWHGWLVAHFRPARVVQGGVETWRTAVQADGKGYPDITAARAGHRLFAELKYTGRRMSSEQERWLGELGPSDERTTVWLWFPEDWQEIWEAAA